MGQSLWKELFDKCDSRVGPGLTNVAKSEEFAAATALMRRTRRIAERRLEDVCRKVLRVFNLPAGTDVNRLLAHVAQLEIDVRALRTELADREHAEFLAQLEAEHAARMVSTKKPSTSSAKASTARSTSPRARASTSVSTGDNSGS